jgi:2-dehydro-3-deoxyphosphogalactonate aldolase
MNIARALRGTNTTLIADGGIRYSGDIVKALAAGAHGLKLFPAEMISPAALKAMRAVLPAGTRLLPVGGISIDTLAAYRTAGAAGFGIGSALYKPGMTVAEVAAQARRFAAAWRGLPAATMGA